MLTREYSKITCGLNNNRGTSGTSVQKKINKRKIYITDINVI